MGQIHLFWGKTQVGFRCSSYHLPNQSKCFFYVTGKVKRSGKNILKIFFCETLLSVFIFKVSF